MASDNGSTISDAEKIRITSDFILHAPPGEFNEVFNDVRMLLGNDQLLKEGCAVAFAEYNKDQFMPVRMDGSDKPTLITTHNDLGNGRFFDPKSRKSFKYDHLRKEASDIQPYVDVHDEKCESWRKALQHAADIYIDGHYPRAGVCAVFGRVEHGIPVITLCIETHQFQPKNF